MEEHRDNQHLPYRKWCKECVDGRGTGEQHRTKLQQSEVPVFAFDYMLTTRGDKVVSRAEVSEDDPVALKVLVAKDTRSKSFGTTSRDHG